MSGTGKGRGGQVILTGDTQMAARGGAATTMQGNLDAMGAAQMPPAVFALDSPLALPVADRVTAKAAGTHANGTPLMAAVSYLNTVATAGDAVVLPRMVPGELIWIINGGANAAQVYGYGTATINGVPTDTGISLGAGKMALFIMVTATNIRSGTLN